MLDGGRRWVRDKMLRVAREGADSSQLRTEVAAVRDQLAALELRMQRDIDFSGRVEAGREAYQFVTEHMPTAPRFTHRHDTLRHALTLAPEQGLALEFGVAAGHSLRVIAGTRPPGTVFGFDSFQGFPEDWRSDFPKGFFAMEPPDVPNAELVAGFFDDTLPKFLADHDEPVAFIHADADMYSSTRTLLTALRDRIRPGVVIQFDEFFNFPGWRLHEYRAWDEFVQENGIRFQYEAYTVNDEQVVARITE